MDFLEEQLAQFGERAPLSILSSHAATEGPSGEYPERESRSCTPRTAACKYITNNMMISDVLQLFHKAVSHICFGG